MKLSKYLFWSLMVMATALVSLTITTGVTHIVIFLAIIYVGLGGFFTGRQSTVNEDKRYKIRAAK